MDKQISHDVSRLIGGCFTIICHYSTTLATRNILLEAVGILIDLLFTWNKKRYIIKDKQLTGHLSGQFGLSNEMAATEAQKLIALSIGKIAMSRQQRGGINLHKNLLVASVLHKARATYMMDNLQTMMANRKAQSEKQNSELRERENVQNKDNGLSKKSESMDVAERGVNDSVRMNCSQEAPKGNRLENVKSRLYEKLNKENVSPVVSDKQMDTSNTSSCSENIHSSRKLETTPIVSGKSPLQVHNGDYVSSSCRCAGSKRRRSFVDTETAVEPKKPKFEEDFIDSCDNLENEVFESDSEELMQTETAQVSNLVNIFNNGLSGLYKDSDLKSDNLRKPAGQVNVYVSTEAYVIKDISCSTEVKDTVTYPTVIALAV